MLDLSPGDYQIKLVARDTRSKRMGSIAHAVQVPPPGIWRVSTPTLTDVVRKEGPTPVPIPVARRAFARGATLYCKFEVFGTPGDGAGSPPRVSAGYAVRTADGRPTAARSDMVPIKPSAQGRLSRILGFSLAGWEPGSYELELTVTDDASGKKRELREPFTVTAGD
jgi:hypothetical protein